MNKAMTAMVLVGLGWTASVAGQSRPIVVLDVPSNLGLRPPRPGAQPGVAKLASALRARGLVQKLGASDAGAVPVPEYRPDPDPETWFRNGQGLKVVSQALADRLGPLVREGQFALVLGGDCSILIGSMMGLKPLGRYGLVFIDGHDDFSVIRDLDRYKGILAGAGLDLGVVTNRAPGGLGNLRGLGPYVREEDVVILGMSPDPEDAKLFATEVLQTTAIQRIPIQEFRQLGAEAAAREALRRLAEKPLDGIWIHLDADVLDQTVFSAVDSPNPNGMNFQQLQAALAILVADPRAVGLEVAIYDPELDPEGVQGDALVQALLGAFGR